MARRQREFNGKVFSDDGTGRLYNAELKKYLIYRPYPLLVDEVRESDKIEPDNKQEYTSEQLKDKFGTDDTSLINAGKEEEDKVTKVEDKKSYSNEDYKMVENLMQGLYNEAQDYKSRGNEEAYQDKMEEYQEQRRKWEKMLDEDENMKIKPEEIEAERKYEEDLRMYEAFNQMIKDEFGAEMELPDVIRPDKVENKKEEILENIKNVKNQNKVNNPYLQKVNNDLEQLQSLENKYNTIKEQYDKEYNEASKEWHSKNYSSDPDSEYQQAYRKLGEISAKYKESRDLYSRINQAKGYNELLERGESVVFDEEGNLLFNPVYENNRFTRKISMSVNVNDENAYKYANILNGVLGQMSDGIWENSPAMNKYWANMEFQQKNDEIVMATDSNHYIGMPQSRYNGWAEKSDDEVRDYIANKIKYIAQLDLKDNGGGKWSRDNTTVLNYFHGDDTTVEDCYKLYDMLKNRR